MVDALYILVEVFNIFSATRTSSCSKAPLPSSIHFSKQSGRMNCVEWLELSNLAWESRDEKDSKSLPAHRLIAIWTT